MPVFRPRRTYFAGSQSTSLCAVIMIDSNMNCVFCPFISHTILVLGNLDLPTIGFGLD
jgi:hypothetical protein